MSGLESEDETGSLGHETVQRVYDWSQVCPMTAVVEAVAAATGRDALAMEPLAESVRVDALDDLFRAGESYDPAVSADTQLTVSYLEYRVTVCGDGTVAVRLSDSST